MRVCLGWLVVVCATAFGGSPARAGVLIGKLDLPPTPERPPSATHGFLDRVENPLATVRPYNPTTQMVIVVEGDEKPVSPPQVTWELVGESFSRPIVAAPAGAEIVIKNVSRTARTLVALEDPKLLVGVINPTGPKSFRVTDAGKVFTITDRDAPHLKGKVVVVNTQFIAYPDESGKFEITDIPAGNYKLKIWYRDNWLERPDDSIDVANKGRSDFNPKVPAGYPVKK
ncbi:MAG: hypothetical protein JWO36_3786 [Myxococcales bacterium]|nr:hypothetical protein [Myxococcales bacterium]